tara:strand:- start:181 stop:678 length:498 start_codon:yes stop_codon:yes gene_type:complete
MNLLYYPNEFLAKEVKDVDIKDPKIDLKEIKEKMTDIMLSNGGIGLSANQIGLDAKIFIMGDTKENISLIINPKVLQHTQDTVLELEGCLSFPNVYMKIRRPKEILAEYYDESLEQKRTHVKGYGTKVFLHEWDHLHGITFKDRVSNMKWNMALKKAKKLEKKYA